MFLIFVFLLCLISCTMSEHSVSEEEFFSDGFESGDLNNPNSSDGTHWSSSAYTTVSDSMSHSGTYSLEFYFEGKATGDAWAEQRFSFGTDIDEFYIRYYIRFPENYEHRSDGNNNKVFRIWHTDYQNDECKVGLSTYYSSSVDTIALLTPIGHWVYEEGPVLDYHGTGVGDISFADGLGRWALTKEHLGKWLCFEAHFKPDLGSGDGALEFWVDGEKIFGSTNLAFNNAPPSPGLFRDGYLMGWSNSGFTEDTYIYIDDVVLSTEYIGPIGTSK